jgi:hypothetical protein
MPEAENVGIQPLRPERLLTFLELSTQHILRRHLSKDQMHFGSRQPDSVFGVNGTTVDFLFARIPLLQWVPTVLDLIGREASYYVLNIALRPQDTDPF